ncbi:MAG: PAS domain S-box protein [Phycisphaerae bacterium]|nr:PAS domain S-box protein [Phycisphaerae bacterium]
MNEKIIQDLVEENERLRIRLQEAEDTVEAIREGAVDAVIVQGANGEQVFTLSGEEAIYRRLVETMNEAGLTVTPDGVILFCNERFGDMVRQPMEAVIGRPLRQLLDRSSHQDLMMLLQQVQSGPWRQRLVFQASDGTPVPARVSANVLRQGDSVSVCLVATDMTELEASEEVIRQINEQRESLREAHQRLTLAVGAGHIGLFDWHMQEDKVYCTGEYEAIYGYPSENGEDITTVVYSDEDFLKKIHPADLPRVEEEMQRAVRQRKNYQVEHRILWADGAVRWVDSRAVFHYDGQGKPVRLVGAVRDVTERKEGEEALRSSEEKYRTLFDAMDEGYCIVEVVFDVDGRAVDYKYIDVNPSFEKLTGLTGVRGKGVRELVPELEEYWFEIYGRVARTGQPVRFENRAEPLGRWYDVYAFRYGEPQAHQVAILFNDISNRKQAEEALRQSEERYRRLVETATEGIWQVDPHYNTVYVNARMAKMLGYTPEEMAGRHIGDFLFPEDHDDIAPRIENRRRGIAESYERALRCKDGSRLWVLVSAAPLQDEQGAFCGSFGMFTDITDRKQAEEALVRARDELEQRVRDRTAELHRNNRELQRRAEQLSRFASELTLAEQRERNRLAKVLHDHLQQLLVAAKLSLQGLAYTAADEEFGQAANDVCELINECIATSRSLTVELSPTILHEAGLGAGLEWLARWMEQKHGLIVHLQTEEGAETDREDIRILLFESVRELLLNVVKHAGVTHARVTLERRDKSLELVVSDEGKGFDPQRLGDFGGDTASGFGLFSIRERLELLGGSLKVESAPQRGSRFTLEAPMVYPTKVDMAKTERGQAEAMLEEHENTPETDGKIRVMVVDDHKVVRQGMCARLKRERDIEIVGEAGNGEEAIEKARLLRPDVILMDFSMPRMDGVEATRVIHADLPDIRIIGLSMYEEADRAKAMLDAGAAGYVTKSAELRDLLGAIREETSAA